MRGSASIIEVILCFVTYVSPTHEAPMEIVGCVQFGAVRDAPRMWAPRHPSESALIVLLTMSSRHLLAWLKGWSCRRVDRHMTLAMNGLTGVLVLPMPAGMQLS